MKVTAQRLTEDQTMPRNMPLSFFFGKFEIASTRWHSILAGKHWKGKIVLFENFSL